jgi:hypothetical protein
LAKADVSENSNWRDRWYGRPKRKRNGWLPDVWHLTIGTDCIVVYAGKCEGSVQCLACGHRSKQVHCGYVRTIYGLL